MDPKIKARLQSKGGKTLYSYQKDAIDEMMTRFDEKETNFNLLFQLPTGGGKTVIFSEIVRQYLSNHDKKVLVMTHRLELCKQTSKVLSEFEGDKNREVLLQTVKDSDNNLFNVAVLHLKSKAFAFS